MFISILIEHKSYPDKYVAIQLLNYLANAYGAQLKASGSLQLIIPLIYYHGKENWQYRPISQIIPNIPETLKAFVPDFNTVFVNLNTMSEGELKNIKNLMLLSALYMQKFSFSQDDLLSKFIDILTIASQDNQRAGNFFNNIIVYFYEIVEIDLDQFKDIISVLPNHTKQDIMTTYQLIKKEGIKEGLEKGLEKSVLNLHKNDFPIRQIADIMEISVDKVKSILKKNKRI